MSKADKSAVMRFLRVIPEFKPGEVVVAEELINYYLEDPVGSGYNIAVAEVNAKVVGYTCYGPTPLTDGTWDLYWIAVDPRAQGSGVGKALMAYTEAKIKGTRGRLILIETASKDEYEKTRRFYDSQGYQLICRIPDFYEPGDDKLILQKKLR
ncbi:MAG: GNAT family N-acetyltransferase [Dehalococcoidales bacterium]|nr:GNAT family N-acetyltransferase [Dehalococcoidales bacterium]